MKPLWYIQPGIRDEGSRERMLNAAQKLNLEVNVETYVPFSEGALFERFPTDRPVIHFGSLNAIRAFQEWRRQMVFKEIEPCWPFAWCDFEELSCRRYYTEYAGDLAQQHFAFFPLGYIHAALDEVYARFADKDNNLFIRPDSNDKIFCGEVVSKELFGKWLGYNCIRPGSKLLCVVSRPETILEEHRVVVVQGKAISSSRYVLAGEHNEGDADNRLVMDVAERIADRWAPHPVFVIDLALMNTQEGQKWNVLEIGSFNAAGFYGCDCAAIMQAVSEVAVELWEETDD